MPSVTLSHMFALSMTLTCTGCIVPLGHGPEIKLEGYTFRHSFNDIATNGSPFGIIKNGMSRDDVLKLMNGYLVRGPIDDRASSDGRYVSYDYFGGIMGESRALYIAAWEGPYTWGVHGRRARFGMFVYYDDQDRVVLSDASEELQG
jgi:hypothetical protein